MPFAVRTAQLLLVLPPLAAATLVGCGDDPGRRVPLPAVIGGCTAGLALGLGRGRDGCRRWAEAVGWVWVGTGMAATAWGMLLVPSYGFGCLILAFVALPLVLCGLGLAAVAGSNAARAWCRSVAREDV